MANPDIMAFVLAGGEGARLRPLTDHEAKPAVHFAQDHRIIDFVLGNLLNSGVSSICVLAQYKPASLIEHVNAVWATACKAAGCGIEIILPDNGGTAAPFRGTAHAVHCSLHRLNCWAPDVIAVFAADHVYRMDVRQMADFHLARDADVTVAAIPVPIGEASAFGVIATDSRGRIRRFQEKPRQPEPIPSAPERAYVSMGNYLFKPEVLVELLDDAARCGGTDFGAHIMPALPAAGWRALAYDFARNELPGVKPYEDRSYWRDVGTLGALARARADVEGASPRLDLRNHEWPIRRDLLAMQPRLSDQFAAATLPLRTSHAPQDLPGYH